MATFALIPGAGGSSWYWHRVVPLLERHGHIAVTPDLPATDPQAQLADYIDTVLGDLDRTGDNGSVVVVGQSMGGLSAPVVAERANARLLVLVAAMIPQPGESGGEWWSATGQPRAAIDAAIADGRDPGSLDDPVATFLHDLSADTLQDALRRPVEQADGAFIDPWPLSVWPAIPTKVIACRHDRLFPLEFMQQLSRDRLGIEPDIIDTGHLPALADPDALVDMLLGYLAGHDGDAPG